MSVESGTKVMERVKAALGVASLDGVALRLGRTRGAVGSWSGRGSVPLDALVQTAEIANCTLDWLVRGRQGSQNATQVESHKASEPPARYEVSAAKSEAEPVYGDVLHFTKRGHEVSFVLVPRYSVAASAGPGQDSSDHPESQVGEIAFEAAWMRSHFGRAGTGFALLDVAGNSMEPSLWDGETILVDLQSQEVVSGGVYVIRDGDDLMVKRLQRLIGGGIEVVSDNASFRSQVVSDRSTLTIIGRVVWPRVR